MGLSVFLAMALALQATPPRPVLYDERFAKQVATAPADTPVVHKEAEIPADIRAFAGTGGGADSGQSYNLSDVADGRPGSRLVWGARIGSYYLINEEHGGLASGGGTFVYDLSGATLRRAGLISVFGAETFGVLGAAPPRNAGPISAVEPRSARPLDEINPFRTFAQFQAAMAAGQIHLRLEDSPYPLSSTACFLKAPVSAPVMHVAGLPPEVVARVQYSMVGWSVSLTDDPTAPQHFRWAVDLGEAFVVDVAHDKSDEVGLVLKSGKEVARPLRPSASFEDFPQFQAYIRQRMSAGAEATALTTPCNPKPSGQPFSRPGPN